MSGFGVILAGDSLPVEGGEIASMRATLETRGPDASNSHCDGNVGLLHTLLATTPESLTETLPLIHAESGCMITADVRLDNREDLLAALGAGEAGRTPGDGEIILLAYLRWGETCVAKLLGDFAFAIWDPRKQSLFAARDHTGMRPAYYALGAHGSIIIASSAEAILATGRIENSINELRVGDYLANLEFADFTSTFFTGINRLPPAHSMVFSGGQLRLARYWSLDPAQTLKLSTDTDYCDAFRAVFDQAVRCRLRNAGGLGAMLSGGLDSTSVAGVAARLLAQDGEGPLHSFSAIGPDPSQCRETATARLAATMPGLDPHFIDYTQLDDYQDDLLRLTKSISEPFDGHMTLPRTVYLAAHRKGIKIMLDGTGGDVVLGRGSWTRQLLRDGKPWQAFTEHRGEREFWGKEFRPWSRFARDVVQALAPQWARDLKGCLAAGAKTPASDLDLLTPDFAQRIGMAERLEQVRSELPSTAKDYFAERAQFATHAMQAAGIERYNRTASAVAIEPRDPFSDVRLIEFCNTLPPDQRSNGKWPKIILRRAMEGVLPDDVRWRKGKSHLGPAFTRAINAHHYKAWETMVANTSGSLQNWTPAEEIARATDWRVLNASQFQNFTILHLAIWLENLKLRDI